MVATRRHPTDFPEPATPTTTTPSSKTSSSASPPASTTTKHHRSTPSKPQVSTISTPSPKAHQPASYIHTPPPALIFWLLLSLPLVLWDTLYIFLRPHSMPGGRFHSPIWTPYALYGTVDYVYGWPAWNEGEGFPAAQAAMNAVETAFYVYYLWVVWSRGRVRSGRGRGKVRSGAKLAWFVGWSEGGRRKTVEGPGVSRAVLILFAGAVMTVSKTVLYWLHEYYSSFANIGHNDFISLLILWVIPNGAWLVVPGYMIYVLSKEIVEAMDLSASGGNAKR